MNDSNCSTKSTQENGSNIITSDDCLRQLEEKEKKKEEERKLKEKRKQEREDKARNKKEAELARKTKTRAHRKAVQKDSLRTTCL